MKRIAIAVMLLAISAILSQETLGGEKYPLVMTAVYTEGHNIPNTLPKHDYTSGDYQCTKGDENHAPECHTILEWAELDRIAGTPATVLFTMADGVEIGVQESSVHKVYETTCSPGVSIIFCDLYYKLLQATQVNSLKQGQFGQIVPMTPEEYQAADAAQHKKLFGSGSQMTVTIHYKLKGKPDKNGFQRIEVDGVDTGTLHVLNPLGDGYYVKK